MVKMRPLRQQNLDNLQEAIGRKDVVVVRICRELEERFSVATTSDEDVVREAVQEHMERIKTSDDTDEVIKMVDVVTYLEIYLPPPEGTFSR